MANSISKQALLSSYMQEMTPNPSVKASPNSYARKARLGQTYQRPIRALRAPLQGPPYLER